MSVQASVEKRYSKGSCLACRHEEDVDKVIEISLGSVLVRVCPSCAIELRNKLTECIASGFRVPTHLFNKRNEAV